MKPIISIVMVLLALFALAAWSGGRDSITQEIAPGVTAAFKHKIVVEQETWPSALEETRAGRQMIRLEHRGGFRLHVRVRENPGDYVVCVVYVDGDGELILNEDSRFVFLYGDREVESKEILLTDSVFERRVFSNMEETVFLTEDNGRYAKVRSGGYLTTVRFDKGSLGGDRGWIPDAFELRGGEYNEAVLDPALPRASGGSCFASCVLRRQP